MMATACQKLSSCFDSTKLPEVVCNKPIAFFEISKVTTIQKGDKVLIADDLLATGGTIKAATELCRKLQADVIGAVAIMELEGLGGREKIGIPCQSLVKFPA